jgi:hypothetical protein
MTDPTRDQILARIAATPLGQQVLAEEDRAVEQRRATAIARLREIEEQRQIEQPKLDRAIEQADEAVAKARTALTATLHRQGIAHAAHIGASINPEKTTLEAMLRDSAPQVAAFTSELNDVYDAVRQQSQSIVVDRGRNPFTEKDEPTVSTTDPSVRRTLEAIKQARSVLAVLAITVASPADLARRVEEIRRSIPRVDYELVGPR